MILRVIQAQGRGKACPTITLNIDPYATVGDLRSEIVNKGLTLDGCQLLHREGRQYLASNSLGLTGYKVRRDDTIFLVEGREEDSFEVVVKCFSDAASEERIFLIDSDTTVFELKKWIENLTGFPWNIQKLRYLSTVLQNDMCLVLGYDIPRYAELEATIDDPDERQFLIIGTNESLRQLCPLKRTRLKRLLRKRGSDKRRQVQVLKEFSEKAKVPVDRTAMKSPLEAQAEFFFGGEQPEINDLFVRHPDPLKTNSYVRPCIYSKLYAVEKKSKFERLAKALGVREITLTNATTAETTVNAEASLTQAANQIGLKVTFDKAKSKFMMETMKFQKPQRGFKPFVPDELKPWLALENDLESMANLRIGAGSILEERDCRLQFKERALGSGVVGATFPDVGVNIGGNVEHVITSYWSFHIKYYTIDEDGASSDDDEGTTDNDEGGDSFPLRWSDEGTTDNDEGGDSLPLLLSRWLRQNSHLVKAMIAVVAAMLFYHFSPWINPKPSKQWWCFVDILPGCRGRP